MDNFTIVMNRLREIDQKIDTVEATRVTPETVWGWMFFLPLIAICVGLIIMTAIMLWSAG